MSTEIQTTSQDGTEHTFTSELPTYLHCDDWIKKNKSKEDYAAWQEFTNTGINTDLTLALYEEWVIDQKIVHSWVRTSGEEAVVSHADLVNPAE